MRLKGTLPLESKKAVTIVKCFICNQLFYSQVTFDTHMKMHQNKLNRKIPMQTMDSFRKKKVSHLSSTQTKINTIHHRGTNNKQKQ